MKKVKEYIMKIVKKGGIMKAFLACLFVSMSCVHACYDDSMRDVEEEGQEKSEISQYQNV